MKLPSRLLMNMHMAGTLKGQCHEIFDLYFFSLIEPIWSPNKQAKMVFLKICFPEDIRIQILKNLTPCRLTLCGVNFFF